MSMPRSWSMPSTLPNQDLWSQWDEHLGSQQEEPVSRYDFYLLRCLVML